MSILTVEQAGQWDGIVRSFLDYDVYYLSGYVRAFQLHGDGEPLLFYYEGEGVRGINVVMKRDVADDSHFAGKLPKDSYFDFATPYGYGGWLIEGDGDPASLFSAYENWCTGHNVVSEFARFHPMLRNHEKAAQAYEILALGETVAMDLSSLQGIWDNLTSKNHNMVRKAVKNGIRIYNGRSPELFEVFRRIYNGTMDRNHASSYYYFKPSFYESLLNDLPYSAQLFYAQMVDGSIVAASIILGACGRMNYHLSGSLAEYRTLAPTNLLLYETAKWGGENGYKTLYLGGGIGSAEDALLTFKKSFYRGEPRRFYIGKKVFLDSAYRQLFEIRGEKRGNSEFFPSYRA